MDSMNGHSAIVGDLVTSTQMINGNSLNVGIGHNGYWFEPWYVPPPPPPVFVYPTTFTVSTVGLVHAMAFPLEAGAKSPCGMAIVEKSGTTGLRASPNVDNVTCLACLRALAKR